MKIFVFSDSHLNKKYDPEFVEWIEYWSKDVDKIIICGDFWDKYFLTVDEFFNTKWADKLFAVIKSKDTHYIYGNHDPKELCNDKVDLFSSTQSEELNININGKDYHFEHGDRFGIPLDAGQLKILGRIGFWFQNTMIKIFGITFLNVFKKDIRNIGKIWGDSKDILVCGHIHCGGRGDNFFVLKPSGFGLRYGLIIDDGNLIEVKGYEQKDINS